MQNEEYKGTASIHGKEYAVEVINGEPFIEGKSMDEFLANAPWDVVRDFARLGLGVIRGDEKDLQTEGNNIVDSPTGEPVESSRYNPLTHLARALWLLDWRDNYVMILTGYFDETGDLPDVDRKIIGMAGFVATATTWDSIHADWNEHIKDQQYTDYHDVDIRRDRKEKRRKPLLDILKKYWVLPLGFFVSMDGFRRLSPMAQLLFGDPYYKAFLYCFYLTAVMGIVDETGKEISDVKVLTIFDKRHEQIQEKALRWYRAINISLPVAERMLEVPTFRSSKDFIPLCMADMLSAILREEFDRQLNSPQSEATTSYKQIVEISENAFKDHGPGPAPDSKVPFAFYNTFDDFAEFLPHLIYPELIYEEET